MSGDFSFVRAMRKSMPMLISLSSVSGGGKTFSALLLAAGMAGLNKVALIDTENGRGSMYADSPGIVKALPDGFLIAQLDPPFDPARYVAAISAAERAVGSGGVIVVDSTSHEWEGTGGCTDIAENNKLGNNPNWAKAKLAHKRFLNHCLSTDAHLIFCLRARDKTKIEKINGKQEYVHVGIQPIAEKSFVFEMLLSLQLDELTHMATPVKVPEPLKDLFPVGHLITKADGERIREWNQEAKPMEPIEQLQKRARAAAEDGSAVYLEFFNALDRDQKKLLASSTHADNKQIAERADFDRDTAMKEEEENVAT